MQQVDQPYMDYHELDLKTGRACAFGKKLAGLPRGTRREGHCPGLGITAEHSGRLIFQDLRRK